MRLIDENTGLVDSEKLSSVAEKLHPYLTALANQLTSTEYTFPESSILLPGDSRVFDRVQSTIQKFDHPNLAAAVVIGIGGSSLGAQTVYDAVKHHGLKRQLFFLETVDPIAIRDVQTHLEALYQSGRHALIIVISKSGATTETIANYGAMVEWLEKFDSAARAHTLVITEENSKLWQYALDHSLTVHAHEPVGGRYSVFSSVGLIPLGLADVNLTKLRHGAQTMLAEGLLPQADKNSALASAAAIYLNLQAGRTIHNTFIFAPPLATFGRWYAQLVGESLGKNGQGITPLTSIGTTDLHSIAQLFLDGPDDKFTTFVSVKDFDDEATVSNQHTLSSLVADIEGKSLTRIRQTILEGVKASYRERKLPYVEIVLDQVDEENLGALLQTKILEVIFLARLMEVNAFDQPAVELYKEKTRKILQQN